VNGQDTQQLHKSVSFFGLVALGLGGIWGSSWLMVSSTWLQLGGGIINALLAWALILILELPFVYAYQKAVPLFPKAEGEMSYASAAFGPAAGFWAAWFGVLVNLIVCCYEIVALVRMIEFLWPSVTAHYWYKIMGAPVSTATIIMGLALIVANSIIHYRGVKLSSAFQQGTSVALIILMIIGCVMAFALGNFANFRPLFGKPVWTGVIAVAAMLPFSMAGWESIAKGAEEASEHRTAGRTVNIAWLIGGLGYIFTLTATGLVIPWQQAQNVDIPFATGLNHLSGLPISGVLLIITAMIGIIGVYNALFYAMTRQMFGMARKGALPGWLAKVHPKYGSPYNTIFFATAIIAIAPFIGRVFLIPLVDAASFAYIILWGSTFLSIVVLGKRHKEMGQQCQLPGGRLMEILGYISILFLFAVMLYPKSPGALAWPTEHIILAALIVIGYLLYASRHNRQEGSRPDFCDLEKNETQ
jgi:amino acid transporter